MTSRIISISRSLGAGGEEVGRTVAKELGFRYADEEIIVEAAQKAGVSPETVAQTEHTPGLVTRILESIGRVPIDPEGWSAHAVLPPATPGYETLIMQVPTALGLVGEALLGALQAPSQTRMMARRTGSPGVSVGWWLADAGSSNGVSVRQAQPRGP